MLAEQEKAVSLKEAEASDLHRHLAQLLGLPHEDARLVHRAQYGGGNSRIAALEVRGKAGTCFGNGLAVFFARQRDGTCSATCIWANSCSFDVSLVSGCQRTLGSGACRCRTGCSCWRAARSTASWWH